MQNRLFSKTVLTAVVLVIAAGAPMGYAQDEKPAPEAAPVKPDAQPEPGDKAAESSKQGPAYDLLHAAAEVLRSAKSLTYTAKTYGTESMESMSGRTTAEVSMLRDESGAWLVRAKGSGKARTGDEQQFDVAWRRETVEFIDHKEKKVVERRLREARGSAYQIASASRVADLVSANPYSTLVSAPTLELEDRQSVDGTDCDVLTASAGTKKSKTRWYFGVEDHLPRKVEKIIEGDKIAGTMVVEFSNVRAATGEPALTPAQVRVEVPKDYMSDRYQPPSAQDHPERKLTDEEKAKMDQRMGEAMAEHLAKGGSGPGPGLDSKAGEKPAQEPVKGDAPATPEGTPQPTPAVPPTVPPAPVAAAPTRLPGFELTSSGGVKVSPESLKGSVAVIDFFGSWMPGKAWQPLLDGAIKDLKDVKIYAASVREKSADAPTKALKDRNISWDHIGGADQLAKDLGIKLFPATVVVGKNGEIVEIFQNCRGEEMAARVKTAVENASK